MRSLWAYIEGVDGLSLPFTATNSSDLAAGSDLALWPSSRRVYSSCTFWWFPILLRSCINVFMTHEEPLGICRRNGGPFPPLHSDQQLQFGGWVRFGTFPLFEALLLLSCVVWHPPILLRSCINAFMTHEDPLGIY